MGFFSYTCAKTNLPVLASTSWPEEFCKVTVLTESGDVFRGVYDGYGRVVTQFGSEVELDDSVVTRGGIKFVLTKFYKGEKFGDLGKSHNDPGQGHFHDEEKIKEWYTKGGFPSAKEYYRAYWGKE